MASRAHCAKTIYKSLNKYLKWGEQPRCKRIDFSSVTMPKKLLRVYCCCLCLALVPDNLDFFQHFTCLEFLISKVLLSVNKCKFTKAASLTLFPCNQMWKLHPPFWLHDNYTFQHTKDCLCFSCWDETVKALRKIYYYFKEQCHSCF